MRSFLLLALLSTSLQANDIVIRAARILDGRGNVVRNAAVVVNDSKILRIDPHPQRADFDLGDRTLMPGGIDTAASRRCSRSARRSTRSSPISASATRCRFRAS
jgi:dihydroorotase-like cyclic amidohydrolase